MSKERLMVLLKVRERTDHFADEPASNADRAHGDHLANYIGDTFIDCMKDPPTEQWTAIAHALRFHGLRIVERDG